MQKFLDGTWHFGTAKLVELKGIWYLHISATKEVSDFTRDDVKHVVGIDRGLRFLETTYDNNQKTGFVSGKQILSKRRTFDSIRVQLQSRGTRSAKRALKRISGRENRWMSDVNHCLSKALVQEYGSGTLFVLEDLEGVSTDENNLKTSQQSHDLRNWTFYDLETKLTYKAHETGSDVLKVDASYTSQRCPRCGRIRKENRDHKMHSYHCDQCGFQTNDDRIGAMNICFSAHFGCPETKRHRSNHKRKARYNLVQTHGRCQPPDDVAAKGCIPRFSKEGEPYGYVCTSGASCKLRPFRVASS